MPAALLLAASLLAPGELRLDLPAFADVAPAASDGSGAKAATVVGLLWGVVGGFALTGIAHATGYLDVDQGRPYLMGGLVVPLVHAASTAAFFAGGGTEAAVAIGLLLALLEVPIGFGVARAATAIGHTGVLYAAPAVSLALEILLLSLTFDASDP